MGRSRAGPRASVRVDRRGSDKRGSASGQRLPLRRLEPLTNQSRESFVYPSCGEIDGDSGNVVLWSACNSSARPPDSFTNLVTGRTSRPPKLPSGWGTTSYYFLSPDAFSSAATDVLSLRSSASRATA